MKAAEYCYYFRKFRKEEVMNILVIGNGFDLAHGLPAKYGEQEQVKRIS